MRTFFFFLAIIGLCVFLTSCDDTGASSAGSPTPSTPAALTISGAPISSGSIGSAYQSVFTASGGTGTGFSWAVIGGNLPPGLQLTSGNTDATIDGMPTTDNTYNVTLEVIDSAQNSATLTHTFVIHTNTLTIANPPTLDYGVIGHEYF
ncbi:MAG: putative Ig domain-containing protein, partial [Planctomycetota bacterium]